MRLLIVGSGKVGTAIAVLAKHLGLSAYLCDVRTENLERASQLTGFEGFKISDEYLLEGVIREKHQEVDCLVNSVPFSVTLNVARLAIKYGINYVDLTEDFQTAQKLKLEAKHCNNSYVLPQTGLAPGLVSVLAKTVYSEFEIIRKLFLRVGALPIFPSNRLKYNLTWSTEGLVNEYVKDCEILEGKNIKLVPPLEGYETFSIDGVLYEAFFTSGGIGTLCETLKGKADYVCYKSIRYPGHREFMHFLLQDLNFKSNPQELVGILERSLPSTGQDLCLIFITCIGLRKSKFEEVSLFKRITNKKILDVDFSAIQIATAAGCLSCAMQALQEGKKGFVKVEDLDTEGVLNQAALKVLGI